MLKTFKHVSVKGISVVVPAKEISIDDELSYYNNDLQKLRKLKKYAGFDKRRVVEEGISTIDLAFNAACNLRDKLCLDYHDLDALILIEQKESYLGPLDSYILHHKLGLSQDCLCSNVSQGCVGWVWGLYLAACMLESGQQKKVLMLAADVPSLGIDLNDRNNAPIFGDGGCATLLEYTENEVETKFSFDTISSGYDKIISPAFGCRLRFDPEKDKNDPFNKPLFEKFRSKAGYIVDLCHGYMDGGAVFDFTLSEVPKNVKKLLEYANITTDDIKLCCLHQANKQIVKTLGMLLGFPADKVPSSVFSKYGNNTMCSIPTVLADHYVSNNSSFDEGLYLCSGFGNGLVVGSVLLQLCQAASTGVMNYSPEPSHMNREGYIEYWKQKLSM